MFSYSQLLLGSLVASAVALPQASTSSQFDPCSYSPDDVVVRDVIVIGGGASGTYGAFAIKDSGKSVVVVEKEPHFGGHVNTYDDPKSGLPLEYGVEGYKDSDLTRAFFKRFDVTVGPLAFSPGEFADFTTGKQGGNPPANGGNVTGMLDLVNKYYPSQAEGINLPSPVPSELLMSFRDFITKNSLQDNAYSIWNFITFVPKILDEIALFAILSFDTERVPIPGQSSPPITAKNNSELYGKAEMELSKEGSALLSSIVVAGQRNDDAVSLVVQTPSTKKLLVASQVLFAAPIVLDNTQPFDLDSQEHDVFAEVNPTSWYSALVADTGLKPGMGIENAVAKNLYQIPTDPYTDGFVPTKVDDIFYATFGGPNDMAEEDVKSQITADIKRLTGDDSVNPTFLAYANNSPFKQQVSETAVANGFYDKLNALQGHRRMYYTGNAFDAGGSSSLFNFTSLIAPQVTKAVDAAKLASGAGTCANRK